MESWRRLVMSSLIAACTFAACGDEDPSDGSGVVAELQAFQDEANRRAREACGAPDDVAELDPEQSEAARCYVELAVDFNLDACTRKAYGAHEDEARARLSCSRQAHDARIDCCRAAETCDYGAAESCNATVDGGAGCGVDDDALAVALEDCDQAASEGNCSSGATSGCTLDKRCEDGMRFLVVCTPQEAGALECTCAMNGEFLGRFVTDSCPDDAEEACENAEE